MVKTAPGKGLGTLRSGVLTTHVTKRPLSHSWVCPTPDAMPPPTSNPKRQLAHEWKTLLPSILGVHAHQSGLIWFIWVQPAQMSLADYSMQTMCRLRKLQESLDNSPLTVMRSK